MTMSLEDNEETVIVTPGPEIADKKTESRSSAMECVTRD